MSDRCTVAIVDDEEIIRDGLKRVVEWDRYGFSVVATFASAAEVVAYPTEASLDLLIVDVRMPLTDGLELIRELKRLRPALCTIILSGHDSFEYAREAIDLGVLGYLLKPVRIEQLEVALARAREAIVVGRRHSRARDRVRSVPDALGYVLERGEAVRWDDRRLRELAPWLSRPPVALVLVDLLPSVVAGDHSFPMSTHEASRAVIRRIVSGRDGLYVAVPLYGLGGVLLLLRSDAAVTRVETAVSRACDEVDGTTCRPAWAGAYTTHLGEYLDRSTVELLTHILESRWWEGVEAIYDESTRRRYPESHPRGAQIVALNAPEYARRLARAIDEGDATSAAEAVRRVVADMEREGVVDPGALSGLVVALSGLIGHALAERGIDQRSLDLGDALDVGRRIAGYSFRTLRDHLSRVVEAAAAQRAGTTRRPHNHTINTALDEIARRYAENIGLGEVADAVGVTPSHLSRLFRNVMNQSFKEYLTLVRIDEAKRLLISSTDRIYQIAGAVGFREQRYFSEVFRRYTGKTPGQYRNEGVGARLGSVR